MNRRNALKRTGLLAGVTLSSSALLGLLHSCAEEDRNDWTPEFLTVDEAATVSALVDTLLPRTDTPGALDVNVDVFLDRFYGRALAPDGQESVRKDLAEFNEEARELKGKPFAELDEAGRAEVLRAQEGKPGRLPQTVWGRPVGIIEPLTFYRGFKSTVVWAYASSEKIGTEVLSYDPVPGEYDGNVPLKEVGNRWSL